MAEGQTGGSAAALKDPAPPVGPSPTSRKVTGEELMFSGRWLRLKRLFFPGPTGQTVSWETLERTTKGRAEVDAVEIVAVLRRRGHEPALVLVRQFRPPVGAEILELPAGLLDARERPEQTAVRELREETGYSGTARERGMTVFFGQAVSNTSSSVVVVDVDGDAPENGQGARRQHLDEGEVLAPVVVPVSQLHNFCLEFQKAGGCVDGKIFMLALGVLNASLFQ
eukprot:m51a1_g9588 ADP-ribose diphosphatase, putative (225) ;mRNA; f:1015250-1016152